MSRTSAGVVTALQAGTAVLALRRGRHDHADGVWGPGLPAVAITSAAVGSGDPWRRWALAGVSTALAVRLEKLMLGRFAPAAWTFPAPVAMSYLLVHATGAKRTEDKTRERPSYREYQDRVAFCLPRPPR